MPDYILLMHNDGAAATTDDWPDYLDHLRDAGRLRGGSAIGPGACFRKGGQPAAITEHIVGFIRIEAHDLMDAQALLSGNPVFEAGGTVEVRELPLSN